MPPATSLCITPTQPNGAAVVFELLGDSSYSDAQAGASGGWQIIDRPRNAAATEWYDRSPTALELTLMLDGFNDPLHPVSIEPQCAAVLGWRDKKPGYDQPPILKVAGPVDKTAQTLVWCLYSFKFGAAIRDPRSAVRYQQEMTLTLWEFVPATAQVGAQLSPAQVAQQTLSAGDTPSARRTYTVRSGDTLSTIAARVLGSAKQWTQLSALNGIRDPNSVTVGQVIKLPQ